MRTIAHITPHAWAYDAFAKIQRHDAGLVDILPQLGVLAAMAAVLLVRAPGRCAGAWPERSDAALGSGVAHPLSGGFVVSRRDQRLSRPERGSFDSGRVVWRPVNGTQGSAGEMHHATDALARAVSRRRSLGRHRRLFWGTANRDRHAADDR